MGIKNKFVAGLANYSSEKVKRTLSAELSRLKDTLDSSTNYDAIKESLGLLEDIAHQFPSETLDILDRLIARLPETELDHDNDTKESWGFSKQFYDTDSLIARSIQIYELLRYLEHERILKTLMELAISTNETISKAAEEGLKKLSEYNLSVINTVHDDKQIGYGVQAVICEDLLKMEDDELKEKRSPLLRICDELLNPTAEGTSWTHDKCTISMSPVQAVGQAKEIRKDTLGLLRKLYGLSEDETQQQEVINVMLQATRNDHRSAFDSPERDMVNENTIYVLDFFLEIIPTLDLQLLERLEESAWRMHHHSTDEAVRTQALKVKSALDSNAEYQTYKTLIGFRGRFGEWLTAQESKAAEEELDSQGRNSWQEEQSARNAKAEELVASINKDNKDEWTRRIIDFASIESNDLATFPVFGHFLRKLGETQPDYGLELLRDHHDILMSFPGLARGLLKSSKASDTQKLILEWISEDKQLFQTAWLLVFIEDLDEELFKHTFVKAVEVEDEKSLTLITQVISEHFTKLGNQDEYIQNYLLPTIEKLTELKSSFWIDRTWFSDNAIHILESLDASQAEIVLSNIIYRPKIDSHADWILAPLARKHPKLVINMFRERINTKDALDADDVFEERYEVVPYSTDKLREALNDYGSLILGSAVDWYEEYDEQEKYIILRYIGKLIKCIFPEISHDLAANLIGLVREKKDEHLNLVIDVLDEYEGNPFIHEIVEAILLEHPENREIREKMIYVLDNTGVVAGEDGFVKAFEQKKVEISGWLNHTDPTIKEFAEEYSNYLDKRIASEKLRADENNTLRRYQYGALDDEGGD